LHLILDFPSDPPELEPEIIHHFDSGVSLFWTDFDSLNNACAATASGNNNPRSSPMTLKTIATLLILSILAIGGANSASAQDSASAQGRDFRSGAFRGEGGGSFQDGGFDRRGLSGYGGLGGGYGYGNDNGYGDWYGISSGHNECPLFRQRVMTRDGWRVRMVPVC